MTRSGVFIFLVFLFCQPAWAAEKLPVPSDAELQRPLSLIKDLFGEEHARAKTDGQLQTLAKKLLSQASKTDVPIERYALLRVARDIAVQGRDDELAFRIVDEIDRTFRIDAVRMKASVLYALSKTARLPGDRKTIAQQALSLVDLAVARDDFELSGKLAQMALGEAKKSRNADLIKNTAARTKGMEDLGRVYEQVTAAAERLKQNPNDPAANLTVGRYRCLVKGDWENGLPLLALGDDEDLKKLATKELGEVTGPDEQVGLGDGWWELAKEEEGRAQEQLRRRAAHWYVRARPSLSGLTKKRIAVRLETAGYDASTGGRPPAIRPEPPRATTAYTSLVKLGALGFSRGNAFRDAAPKGSLLVGLIVTDGRAGSYHVITSVQPIYGTASGERSVSKTYGETGANRTELVAKPGYAVGRINGRDGLLVDAIQIVFMRIGPAGLDANDSYLSEWAGGKGGNAKTISSNGKFVVGIHGRANRSLGHFGLLVAQ